MPVNIFRYKPDEAHGMTASVAAACLSLVSIVALLSLLAWISITGRGRTHKPFLRTHIGTYFISLMVADFAQTIGGIMNIRWIAARQITIGHFCTAQGAIKLFSNLGGAVWSAVIAIHTFRLLFFNAQTSHLSCFASLTIAWTGVIIMVVVGPTVIESEAKGPYFGIAGYWCWVTSGYATERFMLQYAFMYASAFISLVVYTLIFFRLRGNLVAEGYKIRILSVSSSRAWNLQTGRAVMESKTMNIAWQLMWYPLCYTILILPISAFRLAEFSGNKVPFPATVFGSMVFMLSGLVNTVLFITTRHVLPPITLHRKSISSAPQGISVSVHATRTQQVSSATGEPHYVISLPYPNPTEAQEDNSHLTPVLEKSKRRLSGESLGASFTGKDEYDAEANANRDPRAP